jgi:hypothetical protein
MKPSSDMPTSTNTLPMASSGYGIKRTPDAALSISRASRQARVSGRFALAIQCSIVRRRLGAWPSNQRHACLLRLNRRSSSSVSSAARCS